MTDLPLSIRSLKARGTAVKFRALELPEQKALVHAMVVHNSLWVEYEPVGDFADGRSYVEQYVGRYIDEYGNERVGRVRLSMQEMIVLVMECPWPQNFSSWDEYHRDYKATNAAPGRGVPVGSAEVSPVLLDVVSDERIFDGWHRLHDYFESGLDSVPCLFYIPPHD